MQCISLRQDGGLLQGEPEVRFGLFPNNRYNQFPGTTVIAVLAEVDALPSAEIQAPVSNGNGQTDTAQRGLGVSRHVIGSFQGVLVLRAVLRNQTVENGFHIYTNIRVGVLIDAQSATGMLREDVHNACLGQFWQLAQDFKNRCTV